MIESALKARSCSRRLVITVKSAISLGIVALAVLLPQLVHLVAGAQGGVKWLPMYLPVLLGGCMLGSLWGLGIGILSPVVSFLVTLAFGDPMPAAVRLPYMIAELAVFAGVSGLFSKQIAKNGFMAFPAVMLGAVAGRSAFLALVAVFASVSPLQVGAAWAQVQTGLLAIVLQAVLVPAIVMGLNYLLNREKHE